MYKITMDIGTDKWTTMETVENVEDYEKALKFLDDWRKAMRDRKFRLELHTMTVLDV